MEQQLVVVVARRLVGLASEGAADEAAWVDAEVEHEVHGPMKVEAGVAEAAARAAGLEQTLELEPEQV